MGTHRRPGAWITTQQARWLGGIAAVTLLLGINSDSTFWFIGSVVVFVLIFGFLVANDIRRWRRG